VKVTIMPILLHPHGCFLALLALAALSVAGCYNPHRILSFEHNVQAIGPKQTDAIYDTIFVGADSSACMMLPDKTLVLVNQLTVERLVTLSNDANPAIRAAILHCFEDKGLDAWEICYVVHMKDDWYMRNGSGYVIFFENGRIRDVSIQGASPRKKSVHSDWWPGFARSPTSTFHRMPMTPSELIDVFGPITGHYEQSLTHW
jgi:hypothetical protein